MRVCVFDSVKVRVCGQSERDGERLDYSRVESLSAYELKKTKAIQRE